MYRVFFFPVRDQYVPLRQNYTEGAMEKLVIILIPAILMGTLLRLLLLPMKLISRLLIHGAGGLLCLWILNSIAPFTGILFPINAVTVLVAGVLGVPGVGLLAVLELFA